MTKFVILKLGKNWWIVSEEYGHIGPYNKREDAESDRRGINRFVRYEDEDGFVTSQSNPIIVKK
ncbi:hypothetical protein LCGC14_3094710 [marine sediment metagenome]|uniref:DUF2188 domain-containing protein n=1 Tax=marine sediment metagenome TaxID=412755 RepID=A0A0F8YH01_9ZZZZ